MSGVHLRNLSKKYGSVFAVQDVSLEVGTGEFVTILGPSGSGKTTMLSLIAGLTGSSSGTISIADQDMTNVPPAKRNIGLVFQSYALFPHLNVFDNIAFPLRARRVNPAETKQRVLEVCSLVKLNGLEHRKPTELSGGQQQRVALARALVFRPSILLLDEPLGALDRKLREQVQVELKSLQRRLAITTILVTHDQEEALSLSDRIAVLNHGQLEQVSSPTDLYRMPKNLFVANFLGNANFLSLDQSVQDEIYRQFDISVGQKTVPIALGNTTMLRPEQIRMSPGITRGLRARIRERNFLGSGFLYIVEAELVGQLKVFSENSFEAGELTKICWDPDHAWNLPESGGRTGGSDEFNRGELQS